MKKSSYLVQGIFNLFLLLFFYFTGFAQTTYHAGNETQLNTAISSSVTGDIINITGDIVITGEKLITGKSIAINGNGYTISVPVTGVDDQGKFNTSPSNFRVFNLAGSGYSYTFNDLTIKGGSLSSAGISPYYASGGAVLVQTNVTLRMNHCVISNSRCNAANPFANLAAGGAIAVWGTVFMEDCFIVKNAAHFAGALFVRGASAVLYMNKCTVSQNRNTNTGGGGGAAEIQGHTFLNNTTFSNNIAMQGGILQAGGGTDAGYVYVLNSSFTGNVVLLTNISLKSAAVASYLSPSAMYVVNSVFAYNYAGNSHTNPTTFTLADFGGSFPQYTRAYYCVVHQSTWQDASMNVVGNITYTGTANGSDNSIFSGGILSKITDGSGTEIGTAQVYRPLLYTTGDYSAPTLKTSSFLLDASRLGVATRYNNNNNFNQVVAYNSSGSTYTAIGSLTNTGSNADQVLIDQAGNTRNAPPIRGAIDAGGVVNNLYFVKVNAAANGAVTGGTIFGDSYPSGTQVTLTAIPNSGYSFTRWDYIAGGTGIASTNNPYSFTVTGDVTLAPVYTALGGGNYAITYIGNGNTEGTVPSGGTFSAATSLATAGTMAKDGYIFSGWNTNAGGSGTNYAAGASYNSGTNLTLYAKWQEVLWMGTSSNDGGIASNWSTGAVPSSNTSFAVASNAIQDLVMTQNIQAKNIRFRNGGKKIQLGNYDLTATSIADANVNNYINTNGSGKLKINIAQGSGTIFNVGNGNYTPVTITNNSSAADDFTVRVLDELYQGGLSGPASTANRITRSWDIGKTNANGASGIDMLFEWQAAQNSGVTTPALYHHNGSVWQEQSSSNTSSPSPTSLRYTGYTGTFSPFGIAGINAVLPIQWANFEISLLKETVLLQWETVQEQNTKDFIIQHSTNGVRWQPIGSLPAAGYASGLKTYRFVHTAPTAGVNYYRILQRDQDGQFSFSRTNNLRYESTGEVMAINTNPVSGRRLQVSLKQSSELAIWSMDGKKIWQGRLPQGQNHIDISRVANGTYLLQTQQKTMRFIIAR